MSEESREKMRLAKLGGKQSSEHVAARVAGRAGYQHSLETRQQMSVTKGGGTLEVKGDYLYRTGVIGHPLAEEGRVAEHRRVLYDAIGPGPHHCEVRHKCDGTEPLVWDGHFGINVDHIDRDPFNNDRDNLRVACWFCNRNRDNPFHQV
jgi:hypothetical protein